jgi:hypothetical protein
VAARRGITSWFGCRHLRPARTLHRDDRRSCPRRCTPRQPAGPSTLSDDPAQQAPSHPCRRQARGGRPDGRCGRCHPGVRRGARGAPRRRLRSRSRDCPPRRRRPRPASRAREVCSQPLREDFQRGGDVSRAPRSPARSCRRPQHDGCSPMTRIAVIGASGFVGSAVVDAARSAGHDTLSLSGPRLATADTTHENVITALAAQLGDVDVVVNCAGNPDASAARIEDLEAANSVLPGVIGAAARRAAVPRYVHVSSAVVQGRLPVLDSSDRVDGFSLYARSKIDGETRARAQGPRTTTVYRPPSVHSPTRRVTRQLTAIARSPLSTVAAPGDALR